MTAPAPEHYFLEVGLYEKFALDTPESKSALARIQFFVAPLDTYCVGCGQHSVFQSAASLPDVGPGVFGPIPASSIDELLAKQRAWLPHSEESDSSLSQQDVITYVARPKHFTSVFTCSRNSVHELRFITRVEQSQFQKIDQFPSVADLHLGDLSKYRKILGAEYGDLARGVGLFAHGLGVGSFVYLRRIFERQIEAAHASAATVPTWDEGEYQRSRMDEKIFLLQSHLPNFVVENRGLYSILSKGIHELSEAECLDIFPVVRVSIELILDDTLAGVEKAKKVEGSRASISQLLSKLKRRA